ncbi:unnamed protein product [Lactuca saligna]|uniref:Uncharacterized protein n=1 Tax=Lactuca saligna TaxID=75948 RepID=A0AA35V3K9_LACSI|nr:unnamed protein product [Lactuca saligna]
MSPSLKIVKINKSDMKMSSKDESEYWLEPGVSFDLQNTQDSLLELPITPKAFRFLAFVKIAKAPITDNGPDHMFFSFYLKHMKPQYETWSASKITGVKLIGSIEIDSFPNAQFKFVRGSTSQVYEFTCRFALSESL